MDEIKTPIMVAFTDEAAASLDAIGTTPGGDIVEGRVLCAARLRQKMEEGSIERLLERSVEFPVKTEHGVTRLIIRGDVVFAFVDKGGAGVHQVLVVAVFVLRSSTPTADLVG
jgi:hypothetical protein